MRKLGDKEKDLKKLNAAKSEILLEADKEIEAYRKEKLRDF